ncbi:glutaredoxin family protein [Rudaea sp.]|uniref:glutaredoxin family protein n=1 Tax=Rudaea sp. TaxID=2136325 RepID=UPI002ED473E1
MRLILYQRDDCHLCDLALAVLAEANAPEFDSVFVDDDAQLEARYGERVPVLRDEGSGEEIGWPFDAATIMRFLAR